MDERNNNAINALTDLLDNHRAKVAVLLERQRKEIADITRRTEGVHFSKEGFLLVGRNMVYKYWHHHH